MQPTRIPRPMLPLQSRTFDPTTTQHHPFSSSSPRPKLLGGAVLLVSLLTASYSASLQANIQQQQAKLEQQRQSYRQAVKALEQRDFKAADIQLTSLQDYPLYPYLKFNRLRAELEKVTHKQLFSFSQTYAATPLPKRLQQSWLYHQAKRKRWQALLDNYRPELATTSLKCYRLQALQQTGQPDRMLDQTAALWVHGSSRPKACDKPFEQWLESDHFKPEHAWERFWLALERNNLSLARYVSKKLDKAQWKRGCRTSALPAYQTTTLGQHRDRHRAFQATGSSPHADPHPDPSGALRQRIGTATATTLSRAFGPGAGPHRAADSATSNPPATQLSG